MAPFWKMIRPGKISANDIQGGNVEEGKCERNTTKKRLITGKWNIKKCEINAKWGKQEVYNSVLRNRNYSRKEPQLLPGARPEFKLQIRLQVRNRNFITPLIYIITRALKKKKFATVR